MILEFYCGTYVQNVPSRSNGAAERFMYLRWYNLRLWRSFGPRLFGCAFVCGVDDRCQTTNTAQRSLSMKAGRLLGSLFIWHGVCSTDLLVAWFPRYCWLVSWTLPTFLLIVSGIDSELAHTEHLTITLRGGRT